MVFKTTYAVLFLLAGLPALAQQAQYVEVYAGAVPGGRAVELKWVVPTRPGQAGFHILRKSSGEKTWTRLTAQPLKSAPALTPAERRTATAAQRRYEGFRDPLTKAPDGERFYTRLFAAEALIDNAFAQAAGQYFQDATAQFGQTYQYAVTLVLNGEELQYGLSRPLTVGSHQPLTAPTGFTAGQKKAYEVELNWDIRSDVLAYHVLRRVGSGPEVQLNDRPVLVSEAVNGKKPTALFVDRDSTFRIGHTYTYRLAALDKFAHPGQRSAPVTVIIRNLEPPLPVAALTARIDRKQVRLSWNPSRSPDCIGYTVFRRTKLEQPFVRLQTPRLSRLDTAFTDLTAREGTSYHYYLEAEDAAGNRARSAPTNVAFTDQTPPKTPTGLAAKTDTLGRVLLTWNPNAEPDLAGYYVYRGLEEQADTYEQLFLKPQQLTRFLDTLLRTARNRFFYRVTAADKSFNESAPASLTLRLPDVVPPRPPVLDDLRNAGGRVSLTWLPSPSDDVAGYQVFRRTENAPNAAYQFAGRTVAPKFEEDTPPSGEYRYIVVTVDSTGLRSAPSADRLLRLDDGRTLQNPGAPTVRFNPADRSLLVSWTAAPQPGDFAGYQVQLRRGEGGFQAASPYLTATQTTLNRIGTEPEAEVRVVVIGVDGEQLAGPSLKVSTPKP